MTPDRFADVSKWDMVGVDLAHEIHHLCCRLALSLAGRFTFGVDPPATLHEVGPVNDYGHGVRSYP